MSGQHSPEDTARGDDADAELKAEAVPPATLQDVVDAVTSLKDLLLIQLNVLEEQNNILRIMRERR